ncbi:hypothetical protein QVD17_35355 [Tagetes erecta]|uniref:Uncharacterized protein n=1 Tax=Tagetes erecta TaxID=13708 RepID=A0AAD8K0U2_TARER|nr:hypothetical protein QVD17_35355 [Tagetes erecta]
MASVILMAKTWNIWLARNNLNFNLMTSTIEGVSWLMVDFIDYIYGFMSQTNSINIHGNKAPCISLLAPFKASNLHRLICDLLKIIMLVIFFLMFNLAKTEARSVGVCYGQIGDGLPSEQDVINLYKRNGITKMRIYGPNPAILRALRRTNIELIMDVPNDSLQSLTYPNAATTWVRTNILNYPNVRFRYIAVGNEVDPNNDKRQFVDFVLPAMKNVQKAIRDAGLSNQIKVSTATYTGLLSKSYPPRDGTFADNVQGFIEPIIKFLVENNSPMLANIYPFFAYAGTPNIDLSYALFTAPGTVVTDKDRQYSNLFDAMFDAHYAAQSRLGGANLEIVVSETGWPSAGNKGATVENAETYYKNLIAHLKRTSGTPARPGKCIQTYLFAMFDENKKVGEESEKHFGLFSPNQRPKYQLNFN